MLIATPASTGPEEYRARVRGGSDVVDVWWRFEGAATVCEDSALLPALLPIAMRRHEPLRIAGTVSARVLRACGKRGPIQSLLARWWPDLLAPVEVTADNTARPPEGNGIASFFSCGIDSFDTLLRRRAEITHLVHVHGFDLALGATGLCAQARQAAEESAASFGKPLVIVETNVREALSDACVDWGDVYHGPALATVALLLGGTARRVLVPATFDSDELRPWGSHPLLDGEWSSEELCIEHEGFDRTRPEKVALVATSDVALRWLRVCWENRGGAYNCCRCSKCVHTMMALAAVGALDRAPTFPAPIDIRLFSDLEVRCVHLFTIATRALADSGRAPEVARAALRAIARDGA